MRNFFNEKIGVLFVIFAMIGVLCSCENNYEENDDQRDTIISFLESSHSPTLISEEDIKLSLEEEPNFYTTFGSYAFLYIDDYYNAERLSMPEVMKGSRITITFSLYPFSGSTISSSTLPTYTNDPTFEESYIEEGLNTTYWSFLPLELTIGDSNILGSIQQGLTGCREGDSIEIYMTCNMAYEDDVIGVMEQESSLAFFCTINSVEN